MAGVMARDELSEICFMRCDHDEGWNVPAKIFRGLATQIWINKENSTFFIDFLNAFKEIRTLIVNGSIAKWESR